MGLSISFQVQELEPWGSCKWYSQNAQLSEVHVRLAKKGPLNDQAGNNS